MDPNEIFIKTVLTDKVKIPPRSLSKSIKKHVQFLLSKKFAGICSYHGYIKQNSIEIIKMSIGKVKDVHLNGDVEYSVTYNAHVCNPAIGSTVRAKVVNQNMFGILGEVSVMSGNTLVPVLEVIISKMIDVDETLHINNIKIGDMINVEILKKKFELGDEKIINVGKIIQDNVAKHILDGEDAEEEEIEDAYSEEEEDEEEEEEKSEEDEEEDDEEEEEDEEEEWSDEDEEAGGGGSEVGESISDVEI